MVWENRLLGLVGDMQFGRLFGSLLVRLVWDKSFDPSILPSRSHREVALRAIDCSFNCILND